ncbi:MAG: response regulator [Bdellovibrionaceae bacterium]|nr:response regulator [Pseudobdellovibrionaceae bacterium]
METDIKATKKILVVDDDTDLRNAIAHTLMEAGYKTIQAENGKQALEMIQQCADLNLICSDIRMPVMTGIELFDNVKNHKIPFIMMTGFSELIDAPKAHSMGVNEFISKPFTQEDLLSAIELCLHDDLSSEVSTKRDLDSEYCRIQIEDFIMGSKVSSDVFLRLSESKYLMIARSSNPLSRERLESFKSKGLLYLYIPKTNFAAYVGFNLKLAKVAMSKRAPISSDQKLHLFKHTTEILLKDSFVNGVDKETYTTGKNIMESTVQILVSLMIYLHFLIC